MKVGLKLIVIASVLTLSIALAIPIAKAGDTLILEVSPFEGGTDLRFGNSYTTDPYITKEVTFDITCDTGEKYQLIQTISSPIVNEKNEPINPDYLVVYALNDYRNKYGTLYVEQEKQLSTAREIIYYSDSGNSDSFKLGYTLKLNPDIKPGSYRGELAFILEPIDSTRSPVNKVLNIFIDIIPGKLSVEIKTATGGKFINLKSGKPNLKEQDVLVSIKGGLNDRYTITQVAEAIDEENKPVDNLIQYIVRENRKGEATSVFTDIKLRQPQDIYKSSGEPDDFLITYSFGDLSKEKAGLYRVSLSFYLNGPDLSAPELIDTVTLEAENEKIFELTVVPEMGGTLNFRDIKPYEPPRINSVTVEIKSNIGKRYQVTQKVPTEFMLADGYKIPKKYFTLRMESSETKGTINCPDKTEVGIGDGEAMVLFVSDDGGSSDSFKIIYELATPPDLHAGDYSAQILFSLSEI